MIPHPFVHPVPTGAELQGRTCFFCGHGWDNGRVFVEIEVQSDDPAIPAALVITSKHEPGRTIVTHRDPMSGNAHAVTSELHPLICSDCLNAATHQAGFPPAGDVLINQAAEDRQRAEVAERERDEAQRELEELKRGIQLTRPLAALQAVEQGSEKPPTTKRKAAA